MYTLRWGKTLLKIIVLFMLLGMVILPVPVYQKVALLLANIFFYVLGYTIRDWNDYDGTKGVQYVQHPGIDKWALLMVVGLWSVVAMSYGLAMLSAKAIFGAPTLSLNVGDNGNIAIQYTTRGKIVGGIEVVNFFLEDFLTFSGLGLGTFSIYPMFRLGMIGWGGFKIKLFKFRRKTITQVKKMDIDDVKEWLIDLDYRLNMIENKLEYEELKGDGHRKIEGEEVVIRI